MMEKLICLFALIITPAWAYSESFPLFIGTKAGYQSAQDNNYNNSNPDGTIWGLYGGVSLRSNWSWDFGYQYHNDLNASTSSVNIKTWIIESALRYDWYLKDNLSLYGRVGATYWNLEKTQNAFNPIDATGVSPLGEIGVSYNFTSNLRFSSGYQYINSIGNSNTGEYDSHILLMGLTYSFGHNDQSKFNDGSSTAIKQSSILADQKVVKESPQITTFVSKTYDAARFSFDSLTPENHSSIEKIASFLNNYPQAKAIVVGHTDSIGTKAYNLKLSKKRAQTVTHKLVELGVSPTQIEFFGEGESRPIADNHTAAGRAQNRNVEITIPFFQKFN